MNTSLLAFGIPGGPELLIIFVIVIILFGAKKLPELARGLGQSIKEFKKASKEIEGGDDTSKPAGKPADTPPPGSSA
jgi:sec-independent protein translocase protein TatA